MQDQVKVNVQHVDEILRVIGLELNIMNGAFSQTMMRPNMPLRRPSSSPGDSPVSPDSPNPPIETPEGPPMTCNVGAGSINHSLRGSLPPMSVKLCNYCSQQGNLRCTRCKKTCYCSVACQAKDWKAHRHICIPNTPENPISYKLKETQLLPVVNGPNILNPKVNHSEVAGPQRVYIQNLRKNNITKGAKVQASVVELQSPGRFFIHVQSPELMESLKIITLELQKNSSSLGSTYMPDQGEVCAVKFSLDQNWYRGLVQSVAADQKSASVLYIDFGNEEDVTLDKVKPLAAKMELFPPCAVECCVAGVAPIIESWTGECCIAVRTLVAGKSLSITVVDVHEGVCAVDVLLLTIGKHLSMFLIDQEYAVNVEISKKHTEQDIDSLMSASLENFHRQSWGKNENTEARPPDPLTQGLGDVFAAVVTHLQSPYDIICQKLENASVIQELQMKLRVHCSQAPASVNFRPAPGTVCCALFSEDNQWYRAKVLAYSSEQRVCVGYIDFGNSEEVDLGRLQPLSPELLALPMQAIPCALAGVRPVGETWSEDCLQVMRRTMCNRFMCVEITGEREGTALVTMVDEGSDPQANVAEVLIATGCALPANVSTPTRTTVEPALESQASRAAVQEPLEWTCVELPCKGQKVELLISVIENPGEFYCYIHNTKDLQVLVDLKGQLKQHCEADRTPFTPTVGGPCCAMFSGDGAWYRGIVQGVFGEKKARVYFVDYGNSSEVEMAHLRVITPHLLRHPFQAIRCYLAGIEPVGSQWSGDALQRFQAMCLGHPLQGCVLFITERGYGIQLESDGQDVATTLFSEHLVRASGQTQTPGTPKTPQQQLTPAPQHTISSTIPPKAMATNQKEQFVEETAKQANQPETPVPKEASFPVDWRTVELPHREKFQPRIAAVVSPSLFYLLNPGQVDPEKLQHVMKDLAVYCSSQTSPNQGRPPPGAACCAQFSGDKNWYRAVVLETSETDASVVYADYGNSERLAFSSILPIPEELLLVPFQISRCALLGEEHFPNVWPMEVLELFRALLSDGVQASNQAYNGYCNLLSVTLHKERGEGHLNTMILEGLQSTKTKDKTTTTPKPDQAKPTTIITQKPDQTKPTTTTITQKPDQAKPTTIITQKPDQAKHTTTITQKPDQAKHTTTITQKPDQSKLIATTQEQELIINGSPCCCHQLKTKIDILEELILSLMKQLGGLPKS